MGGGRLDEGKSEEKKKIDECEMKITDDRNKIEVLSRKKQMSKEDKKEKKREKKQTREKYNRRAEKRK